MAGDNTSKKSKAAVIDSGGTCNNYTIQEFCDLTRSTTDNLLVFVNIDGTDHNAAKLEHEAFQQTLDLPSTFWSTTLQDSSGFFMARENADENAELLSYDTWFRLLVKMPPRGAIAEEAPIPYEWYKLCFFTRWRPSGRSLIVAFDLPVVLQMVFQELDLANIASGCPFAVHGLLLEKICPVFDSAVWACRDLVREREQKRPKADNPLPGYEELHEIARHAIHSTEMLAIAINVVEAMIQEHRERGTLTLAEREARRSLQYHKTLLQGFHLRSQALESRLGNEMNLTFHVNARSDSAVQGEIAKLAQDDSAAMRTISFLGLIFLPGTFVSAIFSMSFFDFSPPDNATQQFRISSDFWIFWAVSIPVTLVTILIWNWYHIRTQARSKGSVLNRKKLTENTEKRETKVRAWSKSLRDRRSKLKVEDVENNSSIELNISK